MRDYRGQFHRIHRQSGIRVRGSFSGFDGRGVRLTRSQSPYSRTPKTEPPFTAGVSITERAGRFCAGRRRRASPRHGESSRGEAGAVEGGGRAAQTAASPLDIEPDLRRASRLEVLSLTNGCCPRRVSNGVGLVADGERDEVRPRPRAFHARVRARPSATILPWSMMARAIAERIRLPRR